MLITGSIPNIGIAIANEIPINSKKHTSIIKIKNISCEKDFISRKAVKIIFLNLEASPNPSPKGGEQFSPFGGVRGGFLL